MISLGYTNVWQILKDYKFPVDKDSKEFLCKLCEKIMINPHSVPCTCTYCLECIENYLGDEIKLCPGKTTKCQEISKKIISINYDLNDKISQLIVKCPERSCKFESALEKMGEHIVEGKYQTINCPYQNIGCNSKGVTHDNIEGHLRSHEHDHIKQLMEVIDEDLKKNIQKLDAQNVNIFNEIQQIKDNVVQNQETFYERIHEKNQEIEELQLKDQQLHRNIEILTDENILLRNVINRLSERSDDFQRKIDALRAENIERAEITQIDFIRRLTEMREEFSNESKSLTNIQETQNYGKFIWKIEDFHHKMEMARQQRAPQVISKPFYSHKYGYKLCLRLYPNGIRDEIGQSVSIFFNLMKGEYDDILPWPFRHYVTFGIINQDTMRLHNSHTVDFNEFEDKTNFGKPINKMNAKGFGVYRFILIKELLQNEHLKKKDQIFIKCFVTLK